MFEILAASTIFESIFDSVKKFSDLSAVNGMRSIILGLSYALFILGLIRLLTSSPSEATNKMFFFVLALVGLILFPKFATSMYEMTGNVKAKSGISVSNIAKGMDRVAQENADAAYDEKAGDDRDWSDVAGKIGDTLTNLLIATIVAVLQAMAYLLIYIMQFGYFLRDIAFFIALIFVPLGLGFIVSPVGKEKGISLLFGAIGVALWPLGWLMIDFLVQLILAPFDSLLAPPPGAKAGFANPLAGYTAGFTLLVILVLVFGKIIAIFAFGYFHTALMIQRVMSGITGMVFRSPMGSSAVASVPTTTNVIRGAMGGGGASRAMAGGRGGIPASRFGGRRTPPAGSLPSSNNFRGTRPRN